MIFLLRYWREIALGCAVAGVLGFVALAFHWKREAAVERARAAVEAQKADLAKLTTETVEKFHTETRTIVRQGEKEIEIVQSLPSANDPIDDDRRRALCDALGRLRDGKPACDLDRPAEPSPAL